MNLFYRFLVKGCLQLILSFILFHHPGVLANSYNDYVSILTEAALIEGRWLLVDRICHHSLTQPRDSFMVGRDSMNFDLFHGEYQARMRLGVCTFFSAGSYKVEDGTILLLHRKEVANNCGYSQTLGYETYSFNLNEKTKQLIIFAGPFNGTNDICPQGDLIRMTYNKSTE